VNLVVAVFIWFMIYPMMIQIDWHAVKDLGKKPQGLLTLLVVSCCKKIQPSRQRLCGPAQALVRGVPSC
jgi:hypothetical protein